MYLILRLNYGAVLISMTKMLVLSDHDKRDILQNHFLGNLYRVSQKKYTSVNS